MLRAGNENSIRIVGFEPVIMLSETEASTVDRSCLFCSLTHELQQWKRVRMRERNDGAEA